MNTPIRIAAAGLAFGLMATAASAQACACTVRHHRHHASTVRYVTPVRYERRVVRQPVYVRSYDSGYYRPAYYGGGYAPYDYTVVRSAYPYWRPSPVVVSYGDGYYWRHHHRHDRDWDRDRDERWGHGDHGRHRGWDHDRGHEHWRD